MNETPKVMEVVLDRLSLRAQAMISRYELDKVIHNPEMLLETRLDQLVVLLRAEVYGKEESVEVEWPDGWVQALKDRWLPRWAKKRWPVRMQSRLLYARAVFEGLPDLPKNTPVYHVAVLQQPMAFDEGEERR